MRAGSEFRHDAAKRCMQIELAQHHIGQDIAGAVGMAANHRGGGLVAAGLDPQNCQFANAHDCP